jgi:hypothetical protein
VVWNPGRRPGRSLRLRRLSWRSKGNRRAKASASVATYC